MLYIYSVVSFISFRLDSNRSCLEDLHSPPLLRHLTLLAQLLGDRRGDRRGVALGSLLAIQSSLKLERKLFLKGKNKEKMPREGEL